MKTANELTYKIIGMAYKLHTHLGPGLLEGAYKECLLYLLGKQVYGLKKKKHCPWYSKKLS
jgi:GxxExxY protein